ncbi:hypothetical protein JQ633_04815 [Bradyrhizobium tropiciagri]|nr:hypothetical protein [Bradyrhizobium tropiciagri]
MNTFGRAIGTLGVGVLALGHWLWIYESYPALTRAWQMGGAVELYAGIFLIGVGVHALALVLMQRSRAA